MAIPILPNINPKADGDISIQGDKQATLFPANHVVVPSLRSLSYGSKKLELKLKIKPKNPVIIEGFPGFGFVATIAVEYLLDHLKMHSIGTMWSPRLAPMAFVHNKRVVQPLEIFHNDKYNIIVLEAVAGVQGMEWEVADALLELYKKVNAKEIISIEGVGSPIERKEPMAYYYANKADKKKKFEALKLGPIKDGIIFGVAGALMLRAPKDINSSFIFAETASNLPDSKAAAKIVQVLDDYLNLKIDYKPLLKKAAGFEENIKGLVEKARTAAMIKKDKEQVLPYIG